MASELDPAASAVFRRVAPAWWWLRENFKWPALVTIAGVLVTSFGFLESQHLAIVRLSDQVAALPKPAPVDLSGVYARLDSLEQWRAGAEAHKVDQDEHIAGLESVVYRATAVAESTPWHRLTPRNRSNR
jgi:hypothetical protein